MDEAEREKLKQKLQIVNWSDIDETKSVELIEKVQAGEISKDEWDYLKSVVPKFADVVSTGLTTIGSVVKSTTEVQSETMKTMREGINAARDIATHSGDPEVQKLALKSIDGAYERIERMNQDNNSWAGTVVTAIVAVIGVGAWVLSGGRISPKTIA